MKLCRFRTLIVYVTLLVAATFHPLYPVRAEEPIQIIKQSVEIKFDKRVVFHLKVRSTQGRIAKALIFWRIVSMYRQEIELADTFTPASEVDLTYTRNVSDLLMP